MKRPFFARVLGPLALVAVLGTAAHSFAETPEESAASAEAAAPFCSSPPKSLNENQRNLCGYAAQLPNCEAFQQACKQPVSAPLDLSWLAPLGIVLRYVMLLLAGIFVIGFVYVIFVAIRKVINDRTPSEDPAKSAVKVVPLIENAAVAPTLPSDGAAALLARADALLARGDAALALSHYLAASLRSLDEKGFLRIARSQTNGEYLRAIRDSEFRGAVAPMVRAVDRAEFGNVAASAEEVAMLGAAARAIVTSPRRAVATPSPFAAAVPAAALALLLLGCGGENKKQGNPSGPEYFQALTSHQGLTVTPLTHPLAALPDPQSKDAIAVMLNAEETALDDETDHALTAWVANGGHLLLSGPASAWPKELARAMAASKTSTLEVAAEALAKKIAKSIPPPKATDAPPKDVLLLDARDVRLAAGIAEEDADAEEDDDPDESALESREAEEEAPRIRGFTANSYGGDRPGVPLVRRGNGKIAASVVSVGPGVVVTVDESDLFTNAALAYPRNPTIALTLLRVAAGKGTASLAADGIVRYGTYRTIERARRHDGRQGASDPLSALLAAGLRLPLIHAAIFAAILFFAYGRRMGRAEPDRLDSRRAFAEHVEANGLLWAKRKFGPLALATWARFAEERLRARMPKSATDPAQYLAIETGQDPVFIADIWKRATEQSPTERARGDEIAILKTLAPLLDRIDSAPRRTLS